MSELLEELIEDLRTLTREEQERVARALFALLRLSQEDLLA
jgi:hypothetical protein